MYARSDSCEMPFQYHYKCSCIPIFIKILVVRFHGHSTHIMNTTDDEVLTWFVASDITKQK